MVVRDPELRYSVTYTAPPVTKNIPIVEWIYGIDMFADFLSPPKVIRVGGNLSR